MADKESSISIPQNDLVKQNQALRHELDQVIEQNTNLWKTLVDTSRGLQVTTSSIKAAVTSLLMYDIFWDGANQHEFLATINTSIDQASELVKLVVLSSRLQARELEFKCEPHLLQEILSVLRMDLTKQFPDLLLDMDFPPEGNLVQVDYEYFKIALEMLIKLLISRLQENNIHIEAKESSESWFLTFKTVDPVISELIRLFSQSNISPQPSNMLSTENILKLHIICEILRFQKINFEFSQNLDAITLVIPCYGE